MIRNPLKGTFFLVGLMLCFHFVSAQKVLLSLPAGEQLLYPESSLRLFDREGGLQVCTADQQGQYYVYKNNRKLGPYNSVQVATEQIVFPDEEDIADSQALETQNQAYNNEFVQWDDQGKTYLTFKGTKTGPYPFIKDLYLSADKSRFFSIVAKESGPDATQTQFQLISSSGKTTDLIGEPYDLKVDASLGMAVVATRLEKKDPASDEATAKYNARIEELVAKMGEGELSMEQLTKLSEELNQLSEKAQGAGITEYYVFTSDAESFGPFHSYAEPGFGLNSGPRWYLFADGKLYLNGKAVKDYGKQSIPDGFWWSKTGNNYAFRTSESIVFSTGQTFPLPIEIKVLEENGQTVLKWLTFENESKFVYYQKTL
jgi:hypothetical protein